MALYFSSAEWALLDQRQRHLYEVVTMDNYENVNFVGKEGPLACNSINQSTLFMYGFSTQVHKAVNNHNKVQWQLVPKGLTI